MPRNQKSVQAAHGRRFQTFIVAVCMDARKRADVSYEMIATLANVSGNSIRRFEALSSWPHYALEDYVAAYAFIDPSVDDPRELYDRALDWWVAHGHAPLLARETEEVPGTPDTKIIQRVRELATTRASTPGAAAAPSKTIRKRNRASG